MSETTNEKKGFMPMFPGMNAPMPFMPPMPPMDPGFYDWFGGKEGVKKAKKQWEDFKSNMDTFFEQMQEMQSTSREAAKDQWEMFFDQMMQMEDTFISSLPEEAPSVPGMPPFLKPPVSPKACMEKVQEFQKMANEHAVAQTDTFVDFCKQGQEQAKEAVSEAVEQMEANVDKAVENITEEKKAEEKKADEKKNEVKQEEAKKEEAKKPEPKKTQTKKPAAKKAAPKKTEPKKAEPKKTEEKKPEANPAGEEKPATPGI